MYKIPVKALTQAFFSFKLQLTVKQSKLFW